MSRTKSSYDLQQMRVAARAAAEIVAELGKMAVPGATAGQIEARARELCQKHGVEPNFLGYQGYEYATCISVNEEAVHAFPLESKVFQEGDLVSIDFGTRFNGYNSDHCRTFAVGEPTPKHKKLLEVGEAAVENAIKQAMIGKRIGDISAAMQQTAEQAGFSIVKQYIGHGIGKKLHEWPEVPAFGEPGTGPALEANMVICVECQVCELSDELVTGKDGWTASTKDGGFAVMFEHMVCITPGGPEVMTRL